MAISRDEIEKVALLARIKTSDEEARSLESNVSNILDLVDQLQSADTDQVEPLAHPLDAVGQLRDDTVTETNQRAAFQRIAPATEDGLYLVPQVIE
ncbi:aspartyl/glutamyl-tRNA(Asn/Gln) amidotransferase subunit C [Tamilnaduibacter salinus]|uniref:Aspartyl/glutamyl-tRNA(Asn/Gln) amidotransferase subunit C n=1 Tax=Tamilnaduibacter salinus TaxID=1484056 RepID=A0A2A2I500_9GAMM|nr:Asp-tRNA(Asn)/Glu-tRNA(Gln) amidotransferase subunit GatC [Tamilnaduibacter salinus]PAV26200.1 Asp-tRNA(Asn)/Glu-tRNA(Gln) amidotransferase GatCAB subunit C [Tamilnaduibacter salinus]PVY70745.1 aspartyl/glutamyl-tRNA(Asn/Gln) amidotransferase subunit C [Tamilnaduibacter salinus]